MIKLLLIFCFCLSFCSITKAQALDNSNATEQETKDWIISKFNNYCLKNYTENYPQEYVKHSDIKFFFDDCNLVIEYDDSDYVWGTYFPVKNSPTMAYKWQMVSTEHIQLIFPIYAINLFEDGNSSAFKANDDAKLFTENNTKRTWYNQDNYSGNFNGTTTQNADQVIYITGWSFGWVNSQNFFISIMDWSREENLFQRMQNAFNHLKNFCPKPVSNEKF